MLKAHVLIAHAEGSAMSVRVSQSELDRRSSLIVEAMAARSPRWTVMELAAATGIHHTQVSRIVSGKVSGSTTALAAIAAVLTMDLNLLLRPSFEDAPTVAS